MKKKVIITDFLHPYLAQQLEAMQFDVHVQPEITNSALFEVIGDYEGLVLSTKIIVTPKLIDRASKLKFIARAGSGLDTIDVAYAQSKNIHVLSSPEANANAVAEHALGMLLALMNQILKADNEIRNGIWQREENRGYELDGKTVGIIGFGNNGSAFAKKLGGFDVDILVYDKYKSGFGSGRIIESTLNQLQENCDVISFHVPYTEETHFYFNQGFIEAFKKPVWLINTSRGKIVNTADLIAAIKNGKLKGAALDVFEYENFNQMPPDYKLLLDALRTMQNVILTPHVAGWTHESYFKISKILAEKIAMLEL